MTKFTKGSSSMLAKEAYIPIYEHNGVTRNITLGLNTSAILMSDPKLVLFTLSKYKFAGKILQGRLNILEVGCMDGFGSLLLKSFTSKLISVDFFSEHIRQAKLHINAVNPDIQFVELDFLNSTYQNCFDGLVCFDVLEHIDPAQCNHFLLNIKKALTSNGVAIIGMPSLESQQYASEANRRSHINCMDRKQGFNILSTFFKTILPFSMNDEVVHTGFDQMSHYHIYVCSS